MNIDIYICDKLLEVIMWWASTALCFVFVCWHIIDDHNHQYHHDMTSWWTLNIDSLEAMTGWASTEMIADLRISSSGRFLISLTCLIKHSRIIYFTIILCNFDDVFLWESKSSGIAKWDGHPWPTLYCHAWSYIYTSYISAFCFIIFRNCKTRRPPLTSGRLPQAPRFPFLNLGQNGRKCDQMGPIGQRMVSK